MPLHPLCCVLPHSSNDNIIMFSRQIDDDYIIPLAAQT